MTKSFYEHTLERKALPHIPAEVLFRFLCEKTKIFITFTEN